MRQRAGISFGLGGLCLGLIPLTFAQEFAPPSVPEQAGKWETERVELRDGRRLQGLIESEDEAWLNLIQIEQPRGQPMYLVIRPINRTLIRSTTRLKPDARRNLQQQIEQFRNRAQIEAGAMNALRLEQVKDGGGSRRRYQGKWFVLESTLDEEITRRLIVRMEQVFTAYRQILPMRTVPQAPLRVLVFGSPEEYRVCLKPYGLEQIAHPALFLPQQNLVIAGSKLASLAAELAREDAQCQKLELELRQHEQDWPKRMREILEKVRDQGYPSSVIKSMVNAEKRRFDEIADKYREAIKRARRHNDRIFDEAAEQVLTRLYHESFHAYLENYVYPRNRHQVPAWLDEGLAMIFEEALPESGSLRLGSPHRNVLAKLKADLAGQQPLSVDQVLAAGPQEFLAVQGEGAEHSSRFYWYAWGLAYYLTFEKRLLADPALDRYLASDPKSSPPVKRFEDLLRLPLGRFEREWQKYIKTLR